MAFCVKEGRTFDGQFEGCQHDIVANPTKGLGLSARLLSSAACTNNNMCCLIVLLLFVQHSSSLCATRPTYFLRWTALLAT